LTSLVSKNQLISTQLKKRKKKSKLNLSKNIIWFTFYFLVGNAGLIKVCDHKRRPIMIDDEQKMVLQMITYNQRRWRIDI